MIKSLEFDREKYAVHAQNFWKVLETNGYKEANLETKFAHAIVKSWEKKGLAVELLVPLLAHELESVRYAAAANLLKYDALPEAIDVLKDISINSQSLISPTAKLILKTKGVV